MGIRSFDGLLDATSCLASVGMTASQSPLRGRLAALSMAAGAVALSIPAFIGPANGGEGDGVATGALSSDIESYLLQAAALLLMPGVALLMGRVHGRGSRLVVPGGIIYGAGLVGLFVFAVISPLEDLVRGGDPVAPALSAAADRMDGATVLVPTYVLALLCFHLIGLPMFFFGLVRANQIPLIVAVVATVGTLLAFFGSGTALETAGWPLIGVALGAVAFSAWRARPFVTDVPMPVIAIG